VEAAGFTLTARPQRVFMPPGAGQNRKAPTLRQLRHRSTRETAFHARYGDPHAAIQAARRV